MVLRCKYCGGAVRIVDGHYDENGSRASEHYECQNCDKKGGYSFGDYSDETWGCVEKGV